MFGETLRVARNPGDLSVGAPVFPYKQLNVWISRTLAANLTEVRIRAAEALNLALRVPIHSLRAHRTFDVFGSLHA